MVLLTSVHFAFASCILHGLLSGLIVYEWRRLCLQYIIWSWSACDLTDELLVSILSTHVYEYWASLGRSAESCEILTRLNPKLENDHLVVDDACGMTRSEILDALYTELLDLLGVDAASSNRFFNQGPVSRDVIALMHLGIDELISMVSADKLTENTYLNGWRFLDTEMRKRRVVRLGDCRFRSLRLNSKLAGVRIGWMRSLLVMTSVMYHIVVRKNMHRAFTCHHYHINGWASTRLALWFKIYSIMVVIKTVVWAFWEMVTRCNTHIILASVFLRTDLGL